ncbi:MAG: para-aminobenzoate synthetase component 1 [Saprospiraceae bacterium]|jgi:para-aminobenzoate synthetase component 1
MIIYKNKQAAKSVMNYLGKQGVPFLFLIDFEMEKIIICIDFDREPSLKFDINGKTNFNQEHVLNKELYFDSFPISKTEYAVGFEKVMNEIQLGNSFLLNLTYATRVMSNLSLDDIFHLTSAKYRIHLKDEFVCFSPEIFVKIKDGRISSNPMKGTIDAMIDNAEAKILADEKEIAEHYTIVDLIRNDLSRVAKDVQVDKFRYIDHVQTNDKNLLQVSSRISGQLPNDYTDHIGDIMFRLLPAGSISGAPKKKTLEVIRAVENQNRGYYTGICGIFDGVDLDSGVMIRFVENHREDLFYRSGCGITSMSDMATEYQEMIDKVYLPIIDSTPTDSKSKPTSIHG